MSLVVWYPLNGNLNDYSGNNNNLSFYSSPTSLPVNLSGKIGSCYERVTARNNTDFLTSSKPIDLQGDFTMACWAFPTTLHPDTANGLVTNHYHGDNKGAGLNVKYISATDFRISCNTGSGTSRTYYSYYGTSNIYNKWSHLILRFVKSSNTFSLWVNGVVELEWTYAQVNTSRVVNIFDWSVGYITTDYKPATKINDVRIYNHALSEKEIKEISKAKILHYSFNDFQEPTQNLYVISATEGLYFTSCYSTYGGSGKYGFGEVSNLQTVSDTHFLQIEGGAKAQRVSRILSDQNHADYLYCDGLISQSGSRNFEGGETRFYSFDYYGTFGTSIYLYINTPNNIRFVHPDTGVLSTSIALSVLQNRETRVSFGLTNIDSASSTFGSIYMILHYNIATTSLKNTEFWVFNNVQVESKKYSTCYTKGSRSGIINDSSGFNHNAVLVNSTTPKWTLDTEKGFGSYQFNGANSIVTDQIFYDRFNQCYTLSAFIYPTHTLDGSTINSQLINFNAGCFIEFDTGAKTLNYLNSGVNDSYVYGSILPRNTWTFVTWVVDTSTQLCKVYYNGVLHATSSNYTITDIPVGFSSSTILGTNFTGKITDIRLYATALTASDILDLYQTSVSLDNNGNFYCSSIQEYYPKYLTNSNLSEYSFYVYSKQYPSDSTEPRAGVYLNSTRVYNYGRDWHISVWDPNKGNWATNLNFYGASSISGAHARYDVYDGAVRAAQQTAFIKTLQNLDPSYIVIIGGSHAPEFYSVGMKNEMLNYGANSSLLSWTSRQSYVLVGKKGVGEGNSISEGLSNLNSANNSSYTWARVDFTLEKESFKVESSGIVQTSNLSELGITDGLAAYFPFDSNAKDYSGNKNNGVLINSPVISNGVKGNGYDFNYTNLSSIGISSFTNLNFTEGLTISAWVKSNDITKSQNIVSRNGPYFLRITGSTIRCGIASGTWTFINGTIPLSNNIWYHLVLTYDQAKIKGYVNGILDVNADKVGPLNSPASHLYIGNTPVAGENSPFDGTIDEVRIYNRALSSEEILILYGMYSPSGSRMKITEDNLFIKGEIIEN